MGDGGRRETGSSRGLWGGWSERGSRPQPGAELSMGTETLLETPGRSLDAAAGGGEAASAGPTELPPRSPQTCWTPGWVLEDGALGAGAGLASEDAQPCGIRQELFPSGAGGSADYGKHVWAHMK